MLGRTKNLCCQAHAQLEAELALILKVDKALCLSKQEIQGILGELQKSTSNLIDWRTIVKIYTMYKAWCRWDGYSNLTSEDVLVEDDAVTIIFSHAKNDQFYCGTTCTLAVLGNNNFMCPKVVFEAYFKKMGFTRLEEELLKSAKPEG